MMLNDHPLVTSEAAMEATKGPAIANTDSLTDDQMKKRGDYSIYLSQNGLRAQGKSGHDVKTEAEWFKDYEPRQNVTPDYPPTMLLHGEKDTLVLFPQIVQMADELNRHNVEYEFITNPEWNHGFAYIEDDPDVQDANRKILAFLAKHLAANKH